MPEEKSIYQQIIDSGIPNDSHESDLYVKVTEKSSEIVDKYKFKTSVRTFIANSDKTPWYDIPFAYDPFWEFKQAGNPRYFLYAKTLGKKPQDLVRENMANGTHMMGFTLWNDQMLFNCQKEHPEYFLTAYDKHCSLFNHAGYDAWLKKKVEG